MFQTAVVVNQQHQPCAEESSCQRDHMNAAQRCETCQRAVFDDLGIADGAPAESGQETFAGKFCQRPQNRQQETGFGPARQVAFSPHPKTDGRIKRKKRRQQEGEGDGV